MSSAFRLYDYVLSGNCYKVRLLAALLDVEYERVAVDFYPGLEHRGEAFRAINPAGTLPVVELDGQVLVDSDQILITLARRFDPSGRWYPQQAQARAQVERWLELGQQVTQSVGPARLHSMLDWPLEKGTKARAREALLAFETALTQRRLEGGKWLVGEAPSIADIACFPYVALSPDAGLEHDGLAAIRNWTFEVRSLPGFVTMPGIHAMHGWV